VTGESLVETTNWEETLGAVAARLREEFHRAYPFKCDGEVAPNLLALRDAFHAFPVPADVLLIDTSSVQVVPPPRIFFDTDRDRGPVWTLIAHHVADSPGNTITFHGTRALADLVSYFPLLDARFGLDSENYRDSLGKLAFNGCWTSDSSEIVDFVPFDIRVRPADYGRYLAEELFMSHSRTLIQRFKNEVDFNALYALEKDPILSLEEWTRMDAITSCFVKLEDGKPLSFEERQAAVADIQLIPKVSEDVRLTFRRAKDAYIFGYFRYDSFTVALHYSMLALEAAINARWSATLPRTVALSSGQKKAEMHFPSHTRIFEFCVKEGWGLGKVLINGEAFPSSPGKLLDWLEREKIVTQWERERLRGGLNTRNRLSHVEDSSTDMPSSDKLRFAAYLINKLFHGMP
jgi:hypothetical protein